jgi:hypothetical protein
MQHKEALENAACRVEIDAVAAEDVLVVMQEGVGFRYRADFRFGRGKHFYYRSDVEVGRKGRKARKWVQLRGNQKGSVASFN